MIVELLQKISTTLSGVTQLGATYDFNASRYEAYPCAIYQPISFENRYLTTAENIKGYQFRIRVFQEAKIAGKRASLIENLAPTVDAIIAAFDDGWDYGTIDGHRVWVSAESGTWGIDQSTLGELIFADIILTVNLTTNN